ncbi:fungal hydrophobin-domain-containing protein [Daedaleopsis nitida]|nr:fungal hydrophobin-domain-containing protein [Daedaleopsis nitida]
MFSKLFTITALAILAVATPTPGGGGEPPASCSTAPIQCCQSTGKASDPAISGVLGGLGIVVQDVNALVGVTCSPISVVGVGSGSSCSANTVCCADNSYGGLVSIGCVPVTL